MAILPNTGVITPTLGGDAGTWDDKINAAFANYDAHDHTPGKGVAIVTAALNINADIPMGGYALTNLSKITFSTIAAPTTGGKDLFVNTADNELYWRTAAGVNVKLTSGTSINTTLVGGIVGDYAAVGAEVAFDDSNKRYTFKDQSTPSKKWARIASGPVRIYEYNTTEAVYVEHAVAAALASSYTVTWPAALPASTRPLFIDATGSISTAYPTEQIVIPASMYAVRPGTNTTCNFSGSGPVQSWTLNNQNTETLKVPIPLRYGDRVLNFQVYASKASNSSNTITVEFVKYNMTTGARAVVATGTNNANAPGAIVFTPSVAPSETLASPCQYQLEITQSSSAPSSSDVIFGTVITYDHP